MLGSLIAQLLQGGRAPAPAVGGPAAADAPAVPPGFAALHRGALALKDGDRAAAIEAFQEAFVGFRKAGDRRNASLTQKVVSLCFDAMDDAGRAAAAYTRARTLLRQAGLLDEEVRLLLAQAHSDRKRRRTEPAVQALREARSIAQRIGFPEGEADALVAYAAIESSRGRRAEAIRLLESAPALLRRIADADVRLRVLAGVERIAAG